MNGDTIFLCQCQCEYKTLKKVISYHLKSGASKSCGCYNIEVQRLLHKKYNKYDLSGNFGIGYTRKNEKFYFDLEDYDKIKDYCWNYNSSGYVRSSNINSNKTIYLHVFIMKKPDYMIDHINRKKYDCRKENLRPCNFQQNSSNRSVNKNSFTGIIGVTPYKEKFFIARITINHKSINLRHSENIIDVIKMRLLAEKKYFGEFSPQKNLFEKYGIGVL